MGAMRKEREMVVVVVQGGVTNPTLQFGLVCCLWLNVVIGFDQPLMPLWRWIHGDRLHPPLLFPPRQKFSQDVGTDQRATAWSTLASGLHGRRNCALLRHQRNHRQRFASRPPVGTSALRLCRVFRSPPPLAYVLFLGCSPLSTEGRPCKSVRGLQPKGLAHACAHSTSAPYRRVTDVMLNAI